MNTLIIKKNLHIIGLIRACLCICSMTADHIECAYAQADLRLCWSHIPHCLKSHALSYTEGRDHLNFTLIIFSPYFSRSVNLSAFLSLSLLKQAWSWLYFNCNALSSDLGSITLKSN